MRKFKTNSITLSLLFWYKLFKTFIPFLRRLALIKLLKQTLPMWCCIWLYWNVLYINLCSLYQLVCIFYCFHYVICIDILKAKWDDWGVENVAHLWLLMGLGMIMHALIRIFLLLVDDYVWYMNWSIKNYSFKINYL